MFASSVPLLKLFLSNNQACYIDFACMHSSVYNENHGPLVRCSKLLIAHALGIPGTFSPPPRLAIPTCITACASRTYRGACRDRKPAVSFEISLGENVPGIPSACATRNFAYLVRGPWRFIGHPTSMSTDRVAHLGKNSWWCHAMRILYVSTDLCEENLRVTRGIPPSKAQICTELISISVIGVNNLFHKVSSNKCNKCLKWISLIFGGYCQLLNLKACRKLLYCSQMHILRPIHMVIWHMYKG